MKYIIWSNIINIDDFKDFLEEEHPDVSDEVTKYELCENLVTDYLHDQELNLGHLVYDYPIIVLADLGLWYGRRSVYKTIGNTNRNSFCDIFSSTIGDEQEFYVEDGEVQCADYHHDGTNYYIFRVLTCDEEEAFPMICEYLSKRDQHILDKFSKSLAPDVCKVYGWEERRTS